MVEKRITRLEVQITGVPKPVVTWYKNGQEIKNDARVQAHDAKGGVYQLTIKSALKDDTGTYTCKAVNDIGQIECSAELAIEMAPQFLKKLERLDAVEQCEADWFFQLTGMPKPLLEFSRNGEKLDIAAFPDLYAIEELEDKMYCLRFKSVSKKDVGNWSIVASNGAGKASSVNRLESLPLAEPVFLKGLSDTRLQQDIDNKIDIIIDGLPFPKVQWFKNEIKIEPSRKYKTEIIRESNMARLYILNSKVDDDNGLYKVIISNPGGEATSEGTYTVKGFAPRFVEKPEKVYAMTNQQAMFLAIVDGDPMPTVSWSKGGVTLDDSDYYDCFYDEAVDAHFMEIAECKSKDAGNYKVTATNLFASESIPVSLVLTSNPEDVVDYSLKLKSRTPRKLGPDDSGLDWGKLKKGGQRAKRGDEGPDWGKLRHVEKDKKEGETTTGTATDKTRKPFEDKDFDREAYELEELNRRKREKIEAESLTAGSLSSSTETAQQAVANVN